MKKNCENWAHRSFKKALERNFSLVVSTKWTILRESDGTIKRVFEEIYNKYYKEEF